MTLLVEEFEICGCKCSSDLRTAELATSSIPVPLVATNKVCPGCCVCCCCKGICCFAEAKPAKPCWVTLMGKVRETGWTVIFPPTLLFRLKDVPDLNSVWLVQICCEADTDVNGTPIADDPCIMFPSVSPDWAVLLCCWSNGFDEAVSDRWAVVPPILSAKTVEK